MEKLTIVANFNKTVDLLRNTECNQKEKLNYFHQISDFCLSPTLKGNSNYSKYASTAIQILLLFCEDLDSIIRMSAEENLNRIIRSMENNKISRILLDLYGEIKKNGNQKSLRICLNLFSYYCPKIREKNIKWYATKLLPCLQTIANRKETLLIECLSDFIKNFAKYLQISLNDSETYKLMETFLNNIMSDCPVQRRCSAQNIISLIENARNKHLMAKYAISKVIEFLINGKDEPQQIEKENNQDIDEQRKNTILLGILGFFRLLLPIIINENLCDSKQIIEIYDYILYLLTIENQNHSIINASLEVLNSILQRFPNEKNALQSTSTIQGNEGNKILELLTNDKTNCTIENKSYHLMHNEILKKRKSLKNQILNKNSYGINIISKIHQHQQIVKETDIKQQLRQNKVETNDCEINQIELPKSINAVGEPPQSTESEKDLSKAFDNLSFTADYDLCDFHSNKKNPTDEENLSSQLILTDDGGDNESFNSIDFESEIKIDNEGEDNDSDLTEKNVDKSASDWKLQKSTESIGSFFNNLLSHSSTETVTKFFRPSTTKLSMTKPTNSNRSTPLTIRKLSGSKPTDMSFDSVSGSSKQSSLSNLSFDKKYFPSSSIQSTIKDDDTISLESINSYISFGSHVSYQSNKSNTSNTQEFYHQKSTTFLDLSNLAINQNTKEQNDLDNNTTSIISDGLNEIIEDEKNTENKILLAMKSDKDVERNSETKDNALNNELDIGTVHNQNLIYYTTRLITSKFLLTGYTTDNTENKELLISDSIVRVSIKNLALSVLGNCIKLMPEILLLPLEIESNNLIDDQLNSITETLNSTSSSNNSSQEKDNYEQNLNEKEEEFLHPLDEKYAEENLLEIKDDHFGENNKMTTILLAYPLSQSYDSQILKKTLNKTTTTATRNEEKIFDEKSKINLKKNLYSKHEQILSKSEIIESKSNFVMMPPLKVSTPLPSSSSSTSMPIKGITKNIEAMKFQSMDNNKMELTKSIGTIQKNEEIFSNNNKMEKIKNITGLNVLQRKQQKENYVLDQQRNSNDNNNENNNVSKNINNNNNNNNNMNNNNNDNNNRILEFKDQKIINEKNQKQFIHDILLYYNHSDPILRGNIQICIGNFIYNAILMGWYKKKLIQVLFDYNKNNELIENTNNINENINKDDDDDNQQIHPLNINRLLAILIKGFQDEIHTVVIQALSTFDKIFPLLLIKYFNRMHFEQLKLNLDSNNIDFNYLIENLIISQKGCNKLNNAKPNIYYPAVANLISFDYLLSELQLCYHNKYWLIQNKYAEVISNLNFTIIRNACSNDLAAKYENKFIDEFVELLGVEDIRIREQAAESLCKFIRNQSYHNCDNKNNLNAFNCYHLTNLNLIKELLSHHIFNGMPLIFQNLLNDDCNLPIESEIDRYLSKILYKLTNKLMDLDNKNSQLGILTAVKLMLNHFNPIDYIKPWNEFNFVNICLEFLNVNYTLATDLNCQIDLIEIIMNLLAANTLHGKEEHTNQLIDNLLLHILKIINIYYHLFDNQKPMLFIKEQKNDLLFQNAKQMMVLNLYGYFGNDNLYIKLYNILKNAYDSYKITINKESGMKLMSLLRTCLNALCACLEMKENPMISTAPASLNNKKDNNPFIQIDKMKLIEEVLQYLNVLINFVPIESIESLRQLLKYLFDRNLSNKRNEYEKCLKNYFLARKLSFNDDKNAEWKGDINLKQNNDNNCVNESKSGQEQEMLLLNVNNQDISGKDNCNFGGDIFSQNDSFDKGISLYNEKTTKIFWELFECCTNFPLGKSKMDEEYARHIKLFEPLVIFCLSLFLKSNTVIQKLILDLLIQLLEFNVTYSILDSKNVIFEQVLKNLELIETGIVRNSTIIINSIIKFLLYLTKQNHQKLITIPKILSIINSLLANHFIRDCSILALNGLILELFFTKNNTIQQIQMPNNPNNTPDSGSSDNFNVTNKSVNISTNNDQGGVFSISNDGVPVSKELCTQKEVIFGMLEKFIDSKECLKCLAILMLHQKQQQHQIYLQNVFYNPNDNTKNNNIFQQRLASCENNVKGDNNFSNSFQKYEKEDISLSQVSMTSPSPLRTTELSTSFQSIHNKGKFFLDVLTKGLIDGKIKVNNWDDFFILESLFKNSIDSYNKIVSMDTEQFLSILSLFITKQINNFNNLSIAIIILDNILLKTEEIYTMKHIKLYLEQNNITCVESNNIVDCTTLQENKLEINEINYFIQVLYEKINESFLTLKLYSNVTATSTFQTMPATTTAINLTTTSASSIKTSTEFLNQNYNKNKYNFISSEHLNNKYCTLMVKFFKSIYEYLSKYFKFNITYSNASKFLLNLCSNNNIFELNENYYNFECLTNKYLKVEILRIFIVTIASKNYNDSTGIAENNGENVFRKSLILEKLKLYNDYDDGQLYVQTIILREILLKFSNPNLWTIEEIGIFLKNYFSIALTEFFEFLELLLKIQKYHGVLFDCLMSFSETASQREIQTILKLINNNDDDNVLPLDRKIEFLTKIYQKTSENKVTYNKENQSLFESNFSTNKILQKLIERTIKNEIQVNGKEVVEHIFNKMNFKLENYLNERIPGTIDAVAKVTRIVDESWFLEEIEQYSSLASPNEYARTLLEIKSEIKLKKIFSSKDFNLKCILPSCIEVSFKSMLRLFQNDCIQFNPHINYLNMNTLSRLSVSILKEKIDNLPINDSSNSNYIDSQYLAISVMTLIKNIKLIEDFCLIYIESKYIEKFIKDQILKSETLTDTLIKFIIICCNHVESILQSKLLSTSISNNNITKNDNESMKYFYTYLKCIDVMLKENFIWLELNQMEKYATHINKILNTIYNVILNSIQNTIFLKKYKMQITEIENETINNISLNYNNSIDDDKYSCYSINLKKTDIQNVMHVQMNQQQMHLQQEQDSEKSNIKKIILIGELIETNCNVNFENLSNGFSMDTLKSIGISILRMNKYYAYAVTPLEILQNNNDNINDKNSSKLPSIPVEYLSDVDILEKFVKRLSIFGFSSRQQFEEYFMTFLLLINKIYDENMVGIEEQYQIKSTCLEVILELLITYKSFPIVGNKLSRFHHTTRWSKIKCENISVKKLHKVQLLIPGANIFYLPNLERNLSIKNKNQNSHYKTDNEYCANNDYNEEDNNIIGTTYFLQNQYDLNFIWQLMEMNTSPYQSPTEETSGNSIAKQHVSIKNYRYFSELSEIDFKSNSMFIFDVLTELVEQNHVLILPNLVKFCEICENRDQVKYIKEKVSKLQEVIPFDDTISHQHIIYLLCKTQSMLIPSISELSHLCTLISSYLKSSHIFIRNATLSGLLCLLECCSKTNTTMGKLSEELSMLRDLIIGYVTRHGIIEESSMVFSDLHTKLVWTLNFSLIEMTIKFVPDTNLLSNTIISANNLMKNTSNVGVFLSVLHGLERLIILQILPLDAQNKIEKLALKLVKMNNEVFSIPALKLFLSCIYMGSAKQLENTELSNGIVQDDPEIIVQQTDKVDIILNCIKSSTKCGAEIYGQVLCQIIRDLVPPKEILTKVIKEFLAINQPHFEVIARVVYQVFRSAIDSSFLQMLQEWLICSLPTFLNLPDGKNSIKYLTVIFISASINLHLIKLFPITLNECNNKYDNGNNVNKLGQKEIELFLTSSKDFYMKLNHDQKLRFKDIFQKYLKQNYCMKEKENKTENENKKLYQYKVFQLMLESL